jgi:hypothetical protein
MSEINAIVMLFEFGKNLEKQQKAKLKLRAKSKHFGGFLRVT